MNKLQIVSSEEEFQLLKALRFKVTNLQLTIQHINQRKLNVDISHYLSEYSEIFSIYQYMTQTLLSEYQNEIGIKPYHILLNDLDNSVSVVFLNEVPDEMVE